MDAPDRTQGPPPMLGPLGGVGRARPRAARPGARPAGAGAVRPPRGRRRRDARAGRTRRGAARGASAAHAGRARPRSRRAARSGERLARFAGAHPSRPRRLRPDARSARASSASTASTACCSTSASRRCSSTSPSAASPTRRTRRWTCGWIPRPARPPATSSTATRCPSWPASCASTARSGSRCGSPRRSTGPAARPRSTSTAELAELVRSAIPAATRRHGGHPAKRTFQALRIEVNGELDCAARGRARRARRAALSAAGSWCSATTRSRTASSSRPGRAGAADSTPVELPVPLADRGPQLRLLTRGSEPATEDEIAANPRAASVRLRAAERIRESA